MPNKNSIMPSWICSAPPTHDEEGIVHKPEGIVTFPIHSHCPGKGNYQLKQQRERDVRKDMKVVRKAVYSSSGTIVRTKQTQLSCEKAVRQKQQKMIAKSRYTTKEQNLFASSSKNKVLTKEAGITYFY